MPSAASFAGKFSLFESERHYTELHSLHRNSDEEEYYRMPKNTSETVHSKQVITLLYFEGHLRPLQHYVAIA